MKSQHKSPQNFMFVVTSDIEEWTLGKSILSWHYYTNNMIKLSYSYYTKNSKFQVNKYCICKRKTQHHSFPEILLDY